VSNQTFYICRGPNIWGRGSTPAEALKNAKKQGRPRAEPGQACFTIDRCHPDTYVTGLGGLTFPTEHPPTFIGYYDINGKVPTEMP